MGLRSNMAPIRPPKITGYDVKYSCFICYFLWGMTTHGSNSRSNDIKTTTLPLSKTFNLPASAITVSGVCQY